MKFLNRPVSLASRFSALPFLIGAASLLYPISGNATPSGTNGEIFYLANSSGITPIYSVASTGGTPTLRVNAAASGSNSGLSVSSNGNRLGYTLLDPTFGGEVVSRLVSGGTETSESLGTDSSNDAFPTFCPDGSIVFSSRRNGTYNLYRHVGTEPTVTPLTSLVTGEDVLVSSCNSSVIAFERNTVIDCEGGGGGTCRNSLIWIMPSSGGGATQLTLGSGSPGQKFGYAKRPDLSPDGSKILFIGRIWGSLLTVGLYTIPVAGGTATLVFDLGTSPADWVSWSPDGTKIAFVRNGSIFTIPATGGTPVEIDIPHFPGAIAWAPGTTPTEPEDACPSDAKKTSPGICGCGFPEKDSNGDTLVDCGSPRTFGKEVRPAIVLANRKSAGKIALVFEKLAGKSLRFEVTITGPNKFKKVILTSKNTVSLSNLKKGSYSIKFVVVQQIGKNKPQRTKTSIASAVKV